MKVKILCNKKEFFNGTIKKNICYLSQPESGESVDFETCVVVINDGLPQKIKNFEHFSFNLPLGFHKGTAHVFKNNEQKLVLVFLEFFDEMSALLLDDNKINQMFIANKNILFSIGEKVPSEIEESMYLSKNKDIYQKIKEQGLKYTLRIFE